MLGTLFNGMTGLSAHMQKLDVTGNNIANINTTGFKRQTVNFSELLRQRMADRGLPVIENGAVTPVQGSGARVSATTRRFDQGSLVYTGRPLDIAVEGTGFFRLVQDNGEYLYTRDGTLKIDAEGRIVNSRGYVLLDEELPENFTELVVDEKGMVSCKDQEGEIREIGQIELYLFPNPEGLQAVGENMFTVSETSGEPESMVPGVEGAGSLRQGYLESSNVDLVLETQNLIEAQRAFELNARSIIVADQLWSITNNLQK